MTSLSVERCAEPKIADPYRTEILLILDKDILGLQVSMHDVLLMNVGKSSHDGSEDGLALLLGEPIVGG